MPQLDRIVVPKVKRVSHVVAWCYWVALVVGAPLAVVLWHG